MNQQSERTYSVSQLNQAVRSLLESEWPSVWVSGEISNLAQPASGHIYFTIKDASSQVRAAMFRGHRRWLGFAPENGQQVKLLAKVSLYPARGDYQLIVERMEMDGAGVLQAAFDALKQKLSAEGLFDPQSKQPIPEYPRRIGVISSPGGAAIRDILSVLGRRFAMIPVSLYPVAVQGAEAAGQIIRAIGQATERGDCDVLIVARGGGSLEDMQAFNGEDVARAVHACPIPVISGIGHEVDFTITDFVADLRAPTPSAAAEAASPDREEWQRYIVALRARLQENLQRRLSHTRQQLHWLTSRLRHPRQKLQDAYQRLDNLNLRLLATIREHLHGSEKRMQNLKHRLAAQHPATRLAAANEYRDHLHGRLLRAWTRVYEGKQHRMRLAIRGLNLVSPLATLDRGYAIVTHAEDRKLITSASQVEVGESVNARLGQGQLQCVVNKVVKKA